ncbi:RNA polymerase sigma-70 factor (ECF subfamily) [Novosphingobium sp. PhB165]|uniref:RNA polymerase sigma factor n=1 Tax=Novosphingobium sp. PhB165 TaxID=2485105 RepID=UPI0010D2873A|nr:RNA polymerase sigma factor [Novosphingobium sp. PhB165]TCM21682.1 RNA polymerase sigma-70 factor (ECF subfamily) [Novosphingobium sp. PhB165]
MTLPSPGAGLEAAFLAHRDALLRFLRARGAGDAAEDLLHEVWLRIAASRPGPIANPLGYLMRMADMLMIDRYRSQRQADKRDRDWTEVHADTGTGIAADPSPERRVAAAQEAAEVIALLDGLGPRVATAFRRHRIDGMAQRDVAAELGVSLSTVESDLRLAYRALGEWKERRDEA